MISTCAIYPNARYCVPSDDTGHPIRAKAVSCKSIANMMSLQHAKRCSTVRCPQSPEHGSGPWNGHQAVCQGPGFASACRRDLAEIGRGARHGRRCVCDRGRCIRMAAHAASTAGQRGAIGSGQDIVWGAARQELADVHQVRRRGLSGICVWRIGYCPSTQPDEFSILMSQGLGSTFFDGRWHSRTGRQVVYTSSSRSA